MCDFILISISSIYTLAKVKKLNKLETGKLQNVEEFLNDSLLLFFLSNILAFQSIILSSCQVDFLYLPSKLTCRILTS